MTLRGYIHIYTGNGKGKTTAAFGLAVRALCAGKSVFIGQFVKSMKYNETAIEPLFDHLVIQQFGEGRFIEREPTPADIQAAHEGLEKCRQHLMEGKFDMVILDELTIALYYSMLSLEEVLNVLRQRSPHTEVVITGRYAPQELIDIADLVTNMQEVKHYYSLGVLSRNGIDH